MDVRSSVVVGIYICSTPEVCCLCDQPIELNSFAKEIDRRYAHMTCVDKALVWMLAKRRERANVNAD